jgi:hypothetical protein
MKLEFSSIRIFLSVSAACGAIILVTTVGAAAIIVAFQS